ncbi:glycosyltransferase [Vibrio splendidus]|uniref:glycosyltransferase n=1 Tax=Vibrio splendidus TaxID=29497 RepID=UPI0003148598|nr:glycosyltransferase [Vibrio splendidus]OED85735.1 hypothetical protein A144_00280 [Vibrio splendidus ZF-90]OEF18771.1 hypothetical protein A145_13485 [Vibrio splendidus 5S-101]PTP34886.1 hypothetical protein CWN95_11120 [Vibrio splendidus]
MSFSVLLSVYNKEEPHFLDEAIESIYDSQTLKPSEIVLVQDGPLTCELLKVIAKWKFKLGSILVLVELERNQGLANALNIGLEHCTYDLVARMDTDDISLPDRFDIQTQFMKSRPLVVASSGQVIEYDLKLERVLGARNLPLNYVDLIKLSRFRSPLSHPAVMFRKNVILSLGGYPQFSNSQDWALWSLLLSKGKAIENVSNQLLHMRTDRSLLDRRGAKYYLNEIKIFKYQKDIGLSNRYHYFFNVLSKGVLRCSPNIVKKIAYKKLRR